MTTRLNSPIQTPSGVIFPNRLVKAAMAENLADGVNPSDKHVSAYTKWGTGDWGGLLTGNVDVSTVYKGSPGNISVPQSISSSTRDAWKRWAMATQRDGTPAIVQLVHPGRQSPLKSGNRGFFDKAIAPSPVPLNIGDGLIDRLLAKLLFGMPKEMTLEEIDEVVRQFASAAKLAYRSGFKGVELHGAHGYLLSQFLSPRMNVRADAYGGTAAKRAKIVIDVIRAIRKEVPASFCVGIKVNSADIAGAENLEESLEQINLIANEQIDFLEISGGSYENPRMAVGDHPKVMQTAQREAFFLDFAREVRAQNPNAVLMVTGGFRSRKGMAAALESNACDLIGIGRPAVIFPHLPKDIILNKDVEEADAVVELALAKPHWVLKMLRIKLVGIGADTMFYSNQIVNMSEGKQTQAPPTT